VTKILRLLGWIAAILLAILSLVPGQHRPQVLADGQAEHLMAYTLTSVALIGGYWHSRRNIIIALSLTLYAGLLETLQLWVPGRVARISDFTMSALGVFMGLFVLTLGVRLFRRTPQDFPD
jgi:VanZ family protein